MQAGQRVGAFASVWFSLVIKLSGSQTVSHLSMAEQQRWCLDVTVTRFISSLPYWHHCASLFIRLPTAWSACWKAVFLGQIETPNRHLLKLYRWVVTESELGFDFIGATKQWLCRLLALPVASCGPQLDDEAVHCALPVSDTLSCYMMLYASMSHVGVASSLRVFVPWFRRRHQATSTERHCLACLQVSELIGRQRTPLAQQIWWKTTGWSETNTLESLSQNKLTKSITND